MQRNVRRRNNEPVTPLLKDLSQARRRFAVCPGNNDSGVRSNVPVEDGKSVDWATVHARITCDTGA